MREIRFLGSMRKGNDTRNYKYSLFKCPHCGKEVIKKRKDGIKANVCSHKCYSEIRDRRGAYKQYVMISGYKYIQCPNHPNATKKGYVAEHRIIVEKKIGRYLLDTEDIHHIDLNKMNNNPENLLVISKSEHSKIHQILKRRDEYGKFTI